VKRLILAGLLSTACAQALAQTHTDSLQDSPDSISVANVAGSAAPAASGPCPLIGEAPSRTGSQQSAAAFQTQLQQRLDLLDSVTDLCLDNPRFHAQRGLVLQLMGQPAAAVESLERALLLDPDQPGTQLDYALALRDAGDAASAQALLQQISQRSDLPPGLKPVLQSQLEAVRSRPSSAWDQHLKVSVAAGFDSNLNNATSDSQLTLTFPTGEASLILADASRAQRGTAVMTALQYQAIKPVNDHIWVLQAELRHRNTRQADTGYQQLDLAAQWLQAPEAPSQWQARLGYSNLRFGSVDLLHSVRAALVHQWQLAWPVPSATCRPLAGLEADIRRYPATSQLNGTYSGLLLSIVCDAAEGRVVAPATGRPGDFLFGNPYVSLPRFSMQLRSGQDRAGSDQRPGGNNSATDLRTAAYGRLQVPGLPGLDWVTEYSWLQQQDNTGYSPLLGNNATRKSTRQTLRFELAHQLPTSILGGARWSVSAELSRQASNLTAFAAKGQSVYSSLRWDIF
jgi:hypothetical protein